jgi:hypothetical protein
MVAGRFFNPNTGEVLGVVLSSIESKHVIRAEVPVRNSQTGAVESWRTEDESISVPSGIARAAPVHLLAKRVLQFREQIMQSMSKPPATR